MATKATVLRVLLDSVENTGGDTTSEVDESLTLSGYTAISRIEQTLLPTADDEEIALVGDVSGLAIVSTNGVPFSARLADGERLMELGCILVLGFGAADQVVLASADGAVLLTGDGENSAELIIVQVKTTT